MPVSLHNAQSNEEAKSQHSCPHSTMTPPRATTTSTEVERASFLAPTPLGILNLVPPGVRQRIYREVITAGFVRFLETSKAIYNEAIDILLQYGACPFPSSVPGCSESFHHGDRRKDVAELEKRLGIVDMAATCTRTGKPCVKRFRQYLKDFEGHEYCIRGFKLSSRTASQKPHRILLDCNGNNLYRLKRLLLVIRGDFSAETKRALMEQPSGSWQHHWRDALAALHSKEDEDLFFAYELLRIRYEWSFGPGSLVCDEEGAHLAFRPRAHYDKNGWRLPMAESG